MADPSLYRPSSHVLDDLRGATDDPRDLVMALVTLIYLRWADFQEAELESMAAFEGADYKPLLPATILWRAWHALTAEELQRVFFERLWPALEELGNTRRNPMATRLHHFSQATGELSLVDPLRLQRLIHWIADQPFETSSDRRTFLDVLDSILEKSVDRSLRQPRTPPSITRLLIEIAAPAAGERVYDPCFGTAGLLTAACDYVQRNKENSFGRGSAPSLTIFGVERSQEAYLIGLTRLALAGILDPQLELGNSLERIPLSNPDRDGFDVVLADPPWGTRVDAAGLDHFPVRSSQSAGFFIQHALSHLRPEGRAVIAVPQGVLFRGGQEERLRRMLLDTHSVEAVVALPATAFMPHTAIEASILVLRRGGPTRRIRMVDAAAFFEKGKGRQASAIRADLAEQLGRELRSAQPSQHCWDVDAETLAEAGWDLTPRRRDQSGLLIVLESLNSRKSVANPNFERNAPAPFSGLLATDGEVIGLTPAIGGSRPAFDVDVLPLKQCCQIFPGRAIESLELLDHPVGEEPIPYVRIKDVHRGQASIASSWLSQNAAANMDPRWKLQMGDILLSRSGTIGKAGVVRNGAVGAVPSGGLFAIRPDQRRLDPHFLLAYLGSSECRAWLDDRARGATIRHLSRRTIDGLPVPLPPLQMQQRVAAQYRDGGTDVLVLLTRLLNEGEWDPVAESFGTLIRKLSSMVQALNFPMDLQQLDQLSGEVLNIMRHEKVLPTRMGIFHDGANSLVQWEIELSLALAPLRGVRNVPRGPGLLNVLQESANRLQEATRAIRGISQYEAKARGLTLHLAEMLEKTGQSLLSDVRLILTADAGPLQTGEMIEIQLKVHNDGPLPLRDLTITTMPDWGHGESGYIAENSQRVINLAGIAPKVAGTFALVANWSGITLDGQRVEGSREIALSVIEAIPGSEVTETDLSVNPYFTSVPVGPDRDDVFFGRGDLLLQIKRQIASGNVVLLEGNRRSGKSSILCHLEGPNAVPGWMGINCSLQGGDGAGGVGLRSVTVFREIAYCIAKSLHTLGEETPLPDGTLLPSGNVVGIASACRAGINVGSEFSDFRDYAEVALDMLAERDLGMLLMLDEFDKLQEGIDSGITSPQVPENIRFMIQNYPRFSAILTGSRRLKRLRQKYWSVLYGLGKRIGVSSLAAEDARSLVTEPVKSMLTYTREAVERAISLTASQPFLLQYLCNEIFDMAAQLKTRSITLDLVERASDAIIEDNEHFANLWDSAGSDRRRFILCVCDKEVSGTGSCDLGGIQESLAGFGIEVDDESIVADLEFLRELELVELKADSGGGHYVPAIPLMGKWIERQQDFNAVMSKARLETEDQHG